MDKRETILLTGASGFIGQHFIRDFGSKYQIINARLQQRSLADVEFASVSTVLHCAALVHQSKVVPSAEYHRVNTELTEKLALTAKAAGVAHFIFLSTAHVFQDSGVIESPIVYYNENSPCHPREAYGQSKLEAEKRLFSLSDSRFLVSVIRPPMVYGPGGKGSLLRLRNFIQRWPVWILGYDQNLRSILFVQNLTYFIDCCIQKKQAGIFLPQDQAPFSSNELVRLLARVSDRSLLVFLLPSFLRKGLQKARPALSTRLFGNLVLDSQVSSNRLGYRPIFSSEEGFRISFA